MNSQVVDEVDMMRVFFIFVVLLDHTLTAFLQQMSAGDTMRTAWLSTSIDSLHAELY